MRIFPVYIPMRPDKRGFVARGGQVVDGRETGHIIPMFTSGFSTGDFLESMSLPRNTLFTEMKKGQLVAMIDGIVNDPAYGIDSFVINPTDSNLADRIRIPPKLLLATLEELSSLG